MVDLVMVIVVYFGGFQLAAVCACFALRKATKRKTAILLWIAAAVLALAQLALWQVLVSSGNAI